MFVSRRGIGFVGAYVCGERGRERQTEIIGDRQTVKEILSLPPLAPPKTQRQVLVAGAVWLLCIRRVNAMRGQIYEHIHAWERHERGEELEGIGGGGGFINAVSDPELEGRRRGTAAIV